MNLPNIFGNKPKTFDVSQVKYKKPIDEQLVNKLTDYIQLTTKHLAKMGLPKIMVGIFETNSIIAAALLKKALRQAQGKPENIVVMILDFGTEYTKKLSEICNSLNLDAYILKRAEYYQTEVSAYNLHKPLDIRNFYQRFINYHLLIQADQMRAALIDTFDKSDRLLDIRPQGFYGHFMPFYSLYKSELFDLAKYLNIPVDNSQIYQDLPYPGTILTFDKLDPILYLLTEKQLTPEEISQQFNINLHFLKRLKSHIDKQLFQTTTSQFMI